MKIISSAIALALMASTASAGVLLENVTYVTESGTDVNTGYVTEAVYTDYMDCLSDMNDGIASNKETFTGVTTVNTDYENNDEYIYRQVTLKYDWTYSETAYEVYTCTYFK